MAATASRSRQDFTADDANEGWPFMPVTARVHPLTRWLPATDVRPGVLEVRLEFFDRYMHNVKGLGQVRFEISDPASRQLAEGGGAGLGRRFGVWEIDLTNVERNVQHYDDITRTYFFRLQPEAGQRLPDRVLLTMQVTRGDLRMHDTRTVMLR